MLDIILDEFHFSSLWNGGILLFILFGVIIYAFILPSHKDHSIWKTILFIFGLAVLFVAIGSPLNIIGRIKFSTHIIQVILLFFIAPPLLIAGFKTKLVEQIMSISFVKKLVDWITNPFVAIGLFYLLFYGYHIPKVFDLARIDLYLNYFYLLGLFIAAILLWIPLISSRLTYKNKLLYCLANMLLLMPFSLVLLLSTESLYTLYTDISFFIQAIELCMPTGQTLPKEYFEMLLPFAPVAEQHLGGGILFVSQLIIFGFAGLYNYRKQ